MAAAGGVRQTLGGDATQDWRSGGSCATCFHLARALRVVGIGLAAVAWASVIGSRHNSPLTRRAGADVERVHMLAGRIAVLAVVRLRRGGNLPSDRRAWFRALARLAGED
jgi:hypothetical protein